jgi:hypothetical protein
MIQTLLKPILIACSVFIFSTLADTVLHSGVVIQDAQAVARARIKPIRPVAVARHTTRRVIRSTHVYVVRLPSSCTTVVIEGTTLHLCGSTYYWPYNGQYVVVVID